MRFLFYAFLLFCGTAYSTEKIAFIAGNDLYPEAALDNAVRDAGAVRTLLQSKLEFPPEKIHFATNTDRLGFFEKFEQFSQDAENADIVLFYYAGHGMESLDGLENFILPVDADIRRAAESEAALRATGINLMSLTSDLARKTNGAKIVLIDACRQRPAGRSIISGSGGGLAIYDDKRIPADTLMILAAAPERIASDGNRHGPFTEALIEVLPNGGQNLMDTFFRVSDRVQEMTQKQQVPWLKFDGSGKIFRSQYFTARSSMPASDISPAAPMQSTPVVIKDRTTFIQSVAEKFEFISLDADQSTGRPKPFRCTLNGENAFEFEGLRYSGFRFKVNRTGKDEYERQEKVLVWFFTYNLEIEVVGLYILIRTGKLNGFRDYQDYTVEGDIDFRLVIQNLAGGTLIDGEEYIMWFSVPSHNTKSFPIDSAIGFKKDGNDLDSTIKFLGFE